MLRLSFRAVLLVLTVLFSLPSVFAQTADEEKLFYGFETNGTLMGYLEVTITSSSETGNPRQIRTGMFAKMTLLGQDFDLRVDLEHQLDPTTGRVVRFEGSTTQGTTKVAVSVVIRDDQAVFTIAGGDSSTVIIDDDVQLWDGCHFPRVLRDLPAEGAARTYRTFDYNDGTIHDVTYTRGADEVLLLEGEEHTCARFTGRDAQTGSSGDMWIDADGRMFKATLPDGSVIQRASPAVVGKIKRAELDDILLAPVDVAIADFQGIEYMKVRATLKTVGEVVTPESLNVPGQVFTGTVTGNLVDGVFEISHARYEGKGAPVFPPDYGGEEALAKHLGPDIMIESDDPVLVAFAQEHTSGAKDAWEAARRLSQWVAKEIVYEIPGGSARSTYDTRRGECGSHSRLLVALCRGVGIPARLATGCMYAPNYGGTFGQHAWTEVYMGDAGWIPVDATANEVDFVDSGHIRLGGLTSFLPEEMEILDYRVASMEGKREAKLGSFANLPWEVGTTYTYTYAAGGTPLGTDSFTVESREEAADGTLVITCSTRLEMPNRTVVGTTQVDGNGRPLAYHVEGDVQGPTGAIQYTVDCEFGADEVVEKAVQSGQPIERTVKLPAEVYLLDNNNFCGYALLLAAVPLDEGVSLSFRAFHPTSMQLLPVQITVGAKETIEVGGRQVPCTICDLNIAGTPLKLWVDSKGRIRRETEGGGRLVVELELDAE